MPTSYSAKFQRLKAKIRAVLKRVRLHTIKSVLTGNKHRGRGISHFVVDREMQYSSIWLKRCLEGRRQHPNLQSTVSRENASNLTSRQLKQTPKTLPSIQLLVRGSGSPSHLRRQYSKLDCLFTVPQPPRKFTWTIQAMSHDSVFKSHIVKGVLGKVDIRIMSSTRV